MFVGRSSELALLGAQLDGVRRGTPRVVVVEGEAGLGKTALIQRFIADAVESPVGVLRAAADEDEQELPGALLDQLLRAVAAGTSVAGAGRYSTEPVSAGGALLDALGNVGDEPLILLCEDTHWADMPSLRALAFALRRLVAERVLAIISLRPDGRSRLPAGIARLAHPPTGTRIELAGLDSTDTRALVEALGAGDLSPRQGERLRAHTGGNPLHISTLVGELGVDGLRVPADTPLPAPRSLTPLVLAQLHRLPASARDVVLAAAVLGMRPPVADVAAVADADDPLGALEQSTASGLVTVEGFGPEQRVSFVHPLVRAAIYHDLGPAQRARLHRRAADGSTDTTAQLRHREAASTGPDRALSTAFVELAERRIAVGNMSQAARAWASAGRLEPDREPSERLLAEAAACHVGAGEMTEALALSDEAKAFMPGPVRDYMLSYPLAIAGRADDCLDLLRRAWNDVDAQADPKLASYIAIRASTNLGMHKPLADLETWARRALDLDPSGNMTGNAMFTLAVGLGQAARYGDGLELIERLRGRPETSPIARDRWLLPRALLRLWSDDVLGAHADLLVAADVLRRHGPTLSWIVSLNPLVDVEYKLGRWDDAIAHAELGVSAIVDLDFTWMLPYMSAMAAIPSASRGDWATAERHLARAKDALDAVGGELNTSWTAHAHAHVAAARGDHEGVLAGMVPLDALGADEAWADPGVQACRDLQAEALVALGRLEEAEAVVSRLEQTGEARGVASVVASAARVRGVLEAARNNDDAARTSFETALDAAPVGQPFRLALVRLSFGAHLRRTGRRRDAQSQLAAAEETFDALRAEPYLERARRELAATGLAPRRRSTWQPTKLTPQETAVVHLARSGYTNKEIGAELVISVRTVEYHLKNAYMKLGVSSRRELIRAQTGAR